MTRAKLFLKELAAAAVVGLLATSTASAQVGVTNFASPPPGGVGFTWYGGDVTFSGVSKDAWDKDKLYLFGEADFASGGVASSLSGDLSGSEATNRFVGDNYTGTACELAANCQFSATTMNLFSKTFSHASLLALLGGGGNEMILGIYDINANVWNFTGSAYRNYNTAGDPYFAASATGSGTIRVGLEDLDRSALYDRNDMVIDITATPEPASLALLATGLIGIAGAGALRRRRKA